MKNIKSVELGNLAKRLRAFRKQIKAAGKYFKEETELLSEIQRRLAFIEKHKNQCDCPWSADCEHLDVCGDCGMR